MRASLAVLLADDLTGVPIKGSNARVWIEGQKPPVKKTDGWNAFLDLAAGKYTLLAEGGTYERASVEVTVGKSIGTVLMRLRPNRLYRLPPDCLRLEGKAEPGTVMTVYPIGRQSAFKLLKDYEQGSGTVTLYHSGSSTPEGRLFRFISPEGGSENVRIGSSTGNAEGEYLLDTPLANAYPRIGSVLVPASLVTADEKGSFFAVVRCSRSDTGIVIEPEGGEAKTFERGGGNTLTVSLLEK